jgi:hypothetical protein
MSKLRTLVLALSACALCWLPLLPARPQAPSIPGYAVPGTGGNSQTFLPVSAFLYNNITGTGTTVVKKGAGVLHLVAVNNPGISSVITLYDNTAASGTKIGTITTPASGGVPVTLTFDVVFTNGLTVNVSVASDLTIAFQ